MSERTARTWQRGPLPSPTKAPRTWRTRPDPFADVWESDVVPVLARDTVGLVQANTLIDVLCLTEHVPDLPVAAALSAWPRASLPHGVPSFASQPRRKSPGEVLP